MASVVRVGDLEPGEEFETLLTRGTGARKTRELSIEGGVPVRLIYPRRATVNKCLHPNVLVLSTGLPTFCLDGK